MLLIDHKHVSILAIQHNLLIPMNMYMNGVRIYKLPKLLNTKSKGKAHAVIAQYHMGYNLLITLRFNH